MKRNSTALLALFAAALTACAARPPRAETPAASDPGRPTAAIAKTGRVTLSSFALAGRVAWQGLRAVGSAAAGLVTDGTDGASRNWSAETQRTRSVARTEAANVRAAARGTE